MEEFYSLMMTAVLLCLVNGIAFLSLFWMFNTEIREIKKRIQDIEKTDNRK